MIEFRGKNSIKFKDIIIENIKIKEAITWIIKYFKAASEGYIEFELFNKGIMDRRLISRPNHILIQEYEEIEIKDPIIKEIKNRIL